jgi:hypothetical protein
MGNPRICRVVPKPTSHSRRSSRCSCRPARPCGLRRLPDRQARRGGRDEDRHFSGHYADHHDGHDDANRRRRHEHGGRDHRADDDIEPGDEQPRARPAVVRRQLLRLPRRDGTGREGWPRSDRNPVSQEPATGHRPGDERRRRHATVQGAAHRAADSRGCDLRHAAHHEQVTAASRQGRSHPRLIHHSK